MIVIFIHRIGSISIFGSKRNGIGLLIFILIDVYPLIDNLRAIMNDKATVTIVMADIDILLRCFFNS